ENDKIRFRLFVKPLHFHDLSLTYIMGWVPALQVLRYLANDIHVNRLCKILQFFHFILKMLRVLLLYTDKNRIFNQNLHKKSPFTHSKLQFKKILLFKYA